MNALSAKAIFNAARHNFGLVEWRTKSDGNEWFYLGDGERFEPATLLQALQELFGSNKFYVVISRRDVLTCSAEEAVVVTKAKLDAFLPIKMCDTSFKQFVEVNPIGVFRKGSFPKRSDRRAG